MTSTCYRPNADRRAHKSIVELGFQFPNPPNPSDASVFGCAARFNLSTMKTTASSTDLRSTEFSEDREISGSDNDDDDDPPSLRQILASPKWVNEVIDLTSDDDDDDREGDDDGGEGGDDYGLTETASGSPTNALHPPLPSLLKPLAPTADDATTLSAAATPGRKKHPWVNVPSWSPLYRRLQQHSDASHVGTDSLRPTLTEFTSPSKDSSARSAERPEKSPEIPETPAVALEGVRRKEDDHTEDGDEDHIGRTQTVTGDLEVDRDRSFVRDRPDHEHDAGSVEMDTLQRADQSEPIVSNDHFDSSGKALASATARTSSSPFLSDDGPAMVNIWDLTTTKILEKRSGPSGLEYRCEFESLWLTADLVGKAQMGHVRIQCYESELVQARRLGTLREGTLKERKRKLSQMNAN